MCIGCWNELGRPAAFTANTAKAVAAVRRLYTINDFGGEAHIVTEDWNIKDEHVAWCLDNLDTEDRFPEEEAASRAALNLLRPMSEAQRATVLAIHEGFLPAEPPT